jgi:hypothetical protein
MLPRMRNQVVEAGFGIFFVGCLVVFTTNNQVFLPSISWVR